MGPCIHADMLVAKPVLPALITAIVSSLMDADEFAYHMRDTQPIQDARLYQSLLTGCQENWTSAITGEGAPDSPDQQKLDEDEEIREERTNLARETTPTETNWRTRMWRGMRTILRGQESEDRRMRRME